MLDRVKKVPVHVIIAPILAVILALIVGSAFVLTVGENPLMHIKCCFKNHLVRCVVLPLRCSELLH